MSRCLGRKGVDRVSARLSLSSLFVAILSVWILIAGTTVSADTSATVEALSSQELVVEGTLVRMDSDPRLFPSACQEQSTTGQTVGSYTIRVTEVIAGYAEGDTLTFHTLIPIHIPGLKIGAPVLAFGRRAPDYNWTIVGSVALITPNGHLRSRSYREKENRPGKGQSDAAWTTIRGRLRNEKQNALDKLVAGSSGLVVARIDQVTPLRGYRMQYNVTILEGLVGELKHSESGIVQFLVANHCFPNLAVGDSVMLPLTPNGELRSPNAACPNTLLIKCGYAGGFGLSVATMVSRVPVEGGRLQLRRNQ